MALSVLPLSSRAMVAHLFPNLACARMIFSSSSCVKGRCSTCGDSWLHQRRRHDFPDLPGTCLLMSDQFLGPCFCTSFFKASASPDQTAGRSPLWALGVRVAVGRSRKKRKEGGPEMAEGDEHRETDWRHKRGSPLPFVAGGSSTVLCKVAQDATTAIACRLAFGATARPDPLTAGGRFVKNIPRGGGSLPPLSSNQTAAPNEGFKSTTRRSNLLGSPMAWSRRLFVSKELVVGTHC
ncbi:unnamed protein product [Spirodela intermedia]|uniref:Uncharacterized protein n=1 Tax=Spirodela intermedia TaxID=51605 RepID=A0A7I8JM94_SPIIN|nr:unnamed protein product [Spirodela intermedia]CAA6670582.1 unnamed protein product [Spirodela intermedia]